MKLKKKSLMIIACAIALVTIGSLAASADQTTVVLDTSQTSAHTDPITGCYNVYFFGGNDSSSAHNVYLIAQYYYLNSYNNDEDSQYLMAPGACSPDQYTDYQYAWYTTWRLELNPEGWLTKNCTANGFIYAN